MGMKPWNHYQMDRPESGGSDRKEERESSGMLSIAKRELAESEKAKEDARPRGRQIPKPKRSRKG